MLATPDAVADGLFVVRIVTAVVVTFRYVVLVSVVTAAEEFCNTETGQLSS